MASRLLPAELWNIESDPPTLVRRFGDAVYSSAFSRDGARLLTAEKDGTARLWDVRSGESLGDPLQHEADVMVVEFSPVDDRFLTVSWSKVARLWSGEGQLLAELRGHSGVVWDATFSPDGTRIATTSWDRTARMWIVDADELVEKAKERQLPVRPEQLEPYAGLLGK